MAVVRDNFASLLLGTQEVCHRDAGAASEKICCPVP
jgi:hypothetical protein